MLDLTPLAHRSYLAEVERSARPWPWAARRPPTGITGRTFEAARRLLVSLKVREARRA